MGRVAGGVYLMGRVAGARSWRLQIYYFECKLFGGGEGVVSHGFFFLFFKMSRICLKVLIQAALT